MELAIASRVQETCQLMIGVYYQGCEIQFCLMLSAITGERIDMPAGQHLEAHPE
jgi:hypothetical protein